VKKPTEVQQRVLDAGYEPLLAYIPELVAAARRVWGTNDVCVSFHRDIVDGEADEWHGIARPRHSVLEAILEIYPDCKDNIALLSAPQTNPSIVPVLFVSSESIMSVTFELDARTACLS
jgi:hypothetical protein